VTKCEREYQGLEVIVDGVKVSVWVVRLRRVGCDPEGPGEEGETRVGRKRIHRIRAPGFGYHFRVRVGRGTGRTAEMTERERERERESVCVVWDCGSGNVIRKENGAGVSEHFGEVVRDVYLPGCP
jgi:hypothetical protein